MTVGEQFKEKLSSVSELEHSAASRGAGLPAPAKKATAGAAAITNPIAA
jgi:hypothetical protein